MILAFSPFEVEVGVKVLKCESESGCEHDLISSLLVSQSGYPPRRGEASGYLKGDFLARS